MTDETLQAAEEAERLEEGSEISTEETDETPTEEAQPEEQQPEPQAEESDPEWYVQAINRQHKKYRDEERRRLELEQRLQELERQQPKDDRPEIPPAPDPFDDNYEQKVADRDAKIREVAAWEARQQAMQYQQQQEQMRTVQQKAQELQTTLKTYTERANELGIKPEQLQVAGNTVASMGIHDDVANYILQDDKGPLITSYLARNPAEVQQMQMMSPVQAAVHLATQVKQKAESMFGKSQAPKPPESLDGGGAPPQQRGPKGATFE
jgi:hypothetical protein